MRLTKSIDAAQGCEGGDAPLANVASCLGGRWLGAVAAAWVRHQFVKLANGRRSRFLPAVRPAVSATHLDGCCQM